MSMSVLCICLSVSKHPRNCTFSGHHFRACYLRPMLGPSHGGVAMRYFLPVFTARCYASAVLGMGLCLSVSVCLCLCLSQVVVLLKRLNTNNTTRQYRDSSFLMPKNSAKFDRGHQLQWRRMQVGWVKIGDFRQITGYISKTVHDFNGTWFLLKSNRKSYALYRMVTLPMTCLLYTSPSPRDS